MNENQVSNTGPVSSLDLTLFLVGVVVLLAIVAGLLLRSTWANDDRRRNLGNDVDTGLALLRARIDDLAAARPEGTAAQALSDARDRHAAALALRQESPSLLVSKAARAVLLEGLTAVREGDRLAGRDPGPEVPPPTDAVLVDTAMRVRVGADEHLALPAYAPGHAHHFSGGLLGDDEVPGGWYAADFWSAAVQPPAPARGRRPRRDRSADR